MKSLRVLIVSNNNQLGHAVEASILKLAKRKKKEVTIKVVPPSGIRQQKVYELDVIILDVAAADEQPPKPLTQTPDKQPPPTRLRPPAVHALQYFQRVEFKGRIISLTDNADWAETMRIAGCPLTASPNDLAGVAELVFK